MKIKANRTIKSKVERIDNNSNVEDRTTFFYYAFRNVLLVGLPLVLISGFVLSHSLSHVSADVVNNSSGSSTDNLSFSISSSCTLSSVVNGDHSAELINGTYKDNIGKSTITTLCNDGNGYSIYANGYSNDEEGNNNLINTTNSNFSITSGLATSGTTSNWAMSLNNVVNDTSPTPPVIAEDYDGIYGLVPTEWTKVASLSSSATDMNQGSSFTTTYAVYTSSSQTTGTYNGKVKYMLVHPSYKPAVYFMQDVAQWKNTLGMEESAQAIDKRDGKSYWVTKLKDGNIWMTQNLDLCIGCTGTAALTSENTDISTTASGSGIYTDGYNMDNGVWTWTPNNGANTSGVINYYNNTVSGWSNSDITPRSAEGGDTYLYTSNSIANDVKYTSIADCTTDGRTETECKHYHTGNYYNWTAAIASNNSSSASTQYDIAGNSICPKGWRLPIATNSEGTIYEFGDLLYNQNVTQTRKSNLSDGSILYTTNGFYNIRKSPMWLVRSGDIYISTLYSATQYGFYWSSVVYSNTNAYYLYFGNNNTWPINHGDFKSSGRSIRCLARTED